jgi:hypothetical protein
MESRQPDLLKPTLIAGLVFGLAASIPGLNLLNVCCCSLVWGCGFFAAYLYAGASRVAGVAFRPGNGALVGLVAGAFYALAATIFGTIASLLFGPAIVEFAARMVERLPEVPPFVHEMMDQARESAGKLQPVQMIFGFLFSVLVGAVFSTLGGLIGGAVFKHEPPPPPPPPLVPPMPPMVPPPTSQGWGGEPPA